MKLLLALCLLVVCRRHAFGQSESEVRNRLIGTWKLVSTVETLKDGTTRETFGPHGQGFLMYEADGYMCANEVNPDRAKWADTERPTKEEALAAGNSTFAYCGRFQIDAQKSQVIHLPEVATDPGFVGTRQIRPYHFEADKLILSDAVKDDPEVVSWKIVWQKAK